MILNKQDYVLERTTDGGFCAYLSFNKQCCAFGDTPEETIDKLTDTMAEYFDGMYLVEDYI